MSPVGWPAGSSDALYVPAGIALTSAYAAQLVADTLHVTIGGWVLFPVFPMVKSCRDLPKP